MIWNIIQPHLILNRVQLIGKRLKLAETWKGVIKQCEKDAPEQAAELERLWDEYWEGARKKVRYRAQVTEQLSGFDWG